MVKPENISLKFSPKVLASSDGLVTSIGEKTPNPFFSCKLFTIANVELLQSEIKALCVIFFVKFL